MRAAKPGNIHSREIKAHFVHVFRQIVSLKGFMCLIICFLYFGPYQISYIGQVLVSEYRLSIKLSYVDETFQHRPCCVVTNNRFLLIHTAHSHTLQTALL